MRLHGSICDTLYMERKLPGHRPILHLLTLEEECAALSVAEYNRFARRLSGETETDDTPTVAQRVVRTK